ncbi:MAG TPA: hypothetical protein VM911_10155 [Pyrinomonadaceae bacterium]|jgi:hypothetical protein|nr:hypothetical protein [Pyrinomonadaceae bacterium]
MYEHRRRPLLSRIEFAFRVLRHGLLAMGIVFAALGIGILGYHWFENMAWIDATLNASMILGGMGPVNALNTVGGKLFASAYALFSGVVFIGIMGIVLAPFAHRLIHSFHLGVDKDVNGDTVD